MWLIYLMPHLEQALVKWSQPPHSGTKVEGRRAQAFKYDISIAWIRFHFNMKNGLKCSTKAKGIAFGRRKQIWPLLEHIFCFLLIHFWSLWQKIYTCRAENCLFSIANISEGACNRMEKRSPNFLNFSHFVSISFNFSYINMISWKKVLLILRLWTIL